MLQYVIAIDFLQAGEETWHSTESKFRLVFFKKNALFLKWSERKDEFDDTTEANGQQRRLKHALRLSDGMRLVRQGIRQNPVRA